jgi:hypothetical protein
LKILSSIKKVRFQQGPKKGVLARGNNEVKAISRIEN